MNMCISFEKLTTMDLTNGLLSEQFVGRPTFSKLVQVVVNQGPQTR